MMNEILIESQYIGSCGYWSLLIKAEKIFLDKHEHFEKRSYRNRAHILGANGLLRLSIPLESGKHQHSAMKDVRISYKEQWQKLHWQSLASAYRRSPFFEYYEDHFRKFYEEKHEMLFEYNLSLMEAISGILKADLNVVFTDKYSPTAQKGVTDYRSYLMPNKKIAMNFAPYPQVFGDRFEFMEDLCVLDVLFNVGTRSRDYLAGVIS